MKTTEDLFQQRLHTYTITHAIEDGNVLRFHVDYFKPQGKTLPKPGEPLAKRAVIEAILAKHDQATGQRRFNALLATSSINDAIEYHALFKTVQAEKLAADPSFQPLNIACVFSPPAEGNPDVKQIQEDLPQEKEDNAVEPDKKKEALKAILADYNAHYGTNHKIGEFDLYYQDVQKRIKDQQWPDADLKKAFPNQPHHKIDITIAEQGAHFQSEYLLTFLYLPPAEEAARVETWLYEGRDKTGIDAGEVLRGFIDRTDRVLALFDGVMPECRWMDDSETLTYLHSTISTKPHRVHVPETPAYLDALLADQPLIGGLEPRLGSAHLRVLTLSGFPTATTPGILDDLNRLAFPYRWATRAILMDKMEAARMVARIRRQWFAKRKSIAAILKEVMTNEQSALIDTDAANKAADADMALQELGADIAGEAYVTATLIVWDEDPRRADEKLRLVEKVVQGRDFTAMVETVNAVDAWLGSLPGQAYANVRQPPVSTLNLAHMIPLSAVWAGEERDAHFDGPPLLYGKTEGATPFRLSLHVGDVGHTLVVGPTGAGKSVLLALMALQFRRYPGAQVFAFDFGGSIRAATLAMGGDWHDLGGELTEGAEASVFLQPLARIDGPGERSWAAGWIGAILAREGIAITPEVKEHLWSALSSLASAPAGERTITGLAVLLQSSDLKQALRPYCLGGAHGRLLDAEAEELGAASVQAFEIEGLVGTAAAPAVLSYLFHRIGDRLDGRPTLLIIDEGWLALDDESFAGQLREWLKTLRKKNASPSA